MQRRSLPRTDPRYNQVRAKNNDSVKKSREKSRRERDETVSAIDQLEDENQQLTAQIQILKHEYQQLQDLFRQHTGISLDQLLSTESNPPVAPSAPVQPTTSHQSTKPVLTINTHEEKVETKTTSSPSTTATSSSSSSNVQLDATDLDGAIVIINGVEYKIVSMNKTS